MPKSDDTRYASEIPTVLAWDPTYTDSEITKAKSIAFATREFEYDQNCKKALKHKEIIEADMKKRGFAMVNKISWQANFNRNNNGSPADVCFENHAVGGISVKDGSDIIGNFGTKDFESGLTRPRGEDLFRFLATKEFDHLLTCVKTDLINQLKVGDQWTEDRELDYGKYSIERVDEDEFVLKFGSSRKLLTRQELLIETFVTPKGVEKKLPGKWRRVFGDFYQSRKKTYKVERDALFSVLYPIIRERCERIIIADPEKLCQIGGFTEKPYYVSDLKNDRIYFVPNKTQVLNRIEVEIFNKDKDHSFGSGFELGCKIKLVDSNEFATLDFYVCYNSGTFNRGPVIKIQGFQDKEKLWQRIH
jgi:hypothetical protein